MNYDKYHVVVENKKTWRDKEKDVTTFFEKFYKACKIIDEFTTIIREEWLLTEEKGNKFKLIYCL